MSQRMPAPRQWTSVMWGAATAALGLLLTVISIRYLLELAARGPVGKAPAQLALLWLLELVLLRHLRRGARPSTAGGQRLAAYWRWTSGLGCGVAAAVGLIAFVATTYSFQTWLDSVWLALWGVVVALGVAELWDTTRRSTKSPGLV